MLGVSTFDKIQPFDLELMFELKTGAFGKFGVARRSPETRNETTEK